jgi:hypothetical protein
MSLRGWEGAIRVATTEAGLATATNEAKVQSVSVSHGPGLEAIHEIGSRSPVEIKEGNIEIGLDVEVLYVAGSAWITRANVGGTGAHTEYYVGAYPGGYTTGKPKIVLLGKFTDWSIDVSQDGVTTEHVTFIGKTIAVGTI